jgi:hypothetical protein
MRNHATHLCAVLLVTALGACSGRTSTVVNRHDETGGKRGESQRVILRGCANPAGEGGGYELRHVVLLPPAEQPAGQDLIDNPLILSGSWVRLAGGSDIDAQLKSHLNHEMTITGDVVDNGASTIGTSGSAPTQRPPEASVANGGAPVVAVETMQQISDTCAEE